MLRCADPLMARELVTVRDDREAPRRAGRRHGLPHRPACYRGEIKWALIKHGYPVEDAAGFVEAEPIRFRVRDGEGFKVRDYQRAAAETFAAAGAATGGHGVIVLPCGAGKTLVGLLAMERVGASTLILATSTAAVEQWRREIRERTDIPDDAVGTYTGATQGRPPDHDRDLLGAHAAARRRVPPPLALPRAQLRARHLRRGPSPPGARSSA